MDYILREGRTEISNETETLMQGVLDSYEAGIQVTTVNFKIRNHLMLSRMHFKMLQRLERIWKDIKRSTSICK